MFSYSLIVVQLQAALRLMGIADCGFETVSNLSLLSISYKDATQQKP
jgi:hypothetical protein